MSFEAILNRILRRVLMQGVRRGIDSAARGQGGPQTPADREAARQGQETARRARQMMRLMRRIGR
ncbi:hypothetical protein [Phaeovulum vinaykumarii]|uniref:Uncharacterized protein n=1 Tax=Phaeovulum vinaykumarii TaxID=407234 RepID=A0A1N7L5Y1_9RHOB|nr:hypothetical protein [Phaeovulum vinaykumarii]SIS69203.1 hypothetical protein SAMN05421795_102595 [Phaeovulum vinaykumarii]SOB99605.1 hypothetical protein SAMN05878426_102177 [Phaeovulum vinaykumarii]